MKFTSWYRPLNLDRAVELGFLYPNHNNIRMKRKNRLKYRTTLPSDHNYVKIDKSNMVSSLELYRRLVKDKKFVFYPDINLWEKWVDIFQTYIISKNNNDLGIVSIYTLHCIIEETGEEGRLALPSICVGDMASVLPVLLHICDNLKYSVLYFYQHGDMTEKCMEQINAIKNSSESWFSLYNNKINIKAKDISVPLL